MMTGRTLGPYQVVASLGAGGMGEVYEARDTRLNRAVALKILPPVSADNADRRRRFLQEAQLALSLQQVWPPITILPFGLTSTTYATSLPPKSR